jgi:3D (Asp-Asp-Asp) domain-containing protein
MPGEEVMKYLRNRSKLIVPRGFISKRLLLACAACLSLVAAGYYGLRHVGFGATSAAIQKQTQWSCSSGWYVTGYYIPKEDELPGDAQNIYVERVGNLSFSEDFLNETQMEGWGVTRFGWALGYHSGGWHRSDAGALDASGNPLKIGDIAIDRKVIPRDSQVQISTLPTPWASRTLRATDVGVGITGQHIDVFTGTGETAEEETFRITSNDNRVCFQN